MPEQRKYYVFCEDKCLFEGMTKEQILAVIAEATGVVPESIDIDAAFITKIKEQNTNSPVNLWTGTEAEYNAIEEKADDTIYIYTTDFEEEITNEIQKIKDGTTVVGSAENATNVNNLEIIRDSNGVLKIGDTIIPQKNLLFQSSNSGTSFYTDVRLQGKKLEISCEETGADNPLMIETIKSSVDEEEETFPIFFRIQTNSEHTKTQFTFYLITIQTNALSRIATIVFKQAIIKDNTTTIQDLNVNEVKIYEVIE